MILSEKNGSLLIAWEEMFTSQEENSVLFDPVDKLRSEGGKPLFPLAPL